MLGYVYPLPAANGWQRTTQPHSNSATSIACSADAIHTGQGRAALADVEDWRTTEPRMLLEGSQRRKSALQPSSRRSRASGTCRSRTSLPGHVSSLPLRSTSMLTPATNCRPYACKRTHCCTPWLRLDEQETGS